MKLSAALVACNENMQYLQFWPLVKRAWYEVVGIPCILVYVAETLHPGLEGDPAVVHFKPNATCAWPTATQAQVIRLLWPALLAADGAILLSDMDMIPMSRSFFVDGFAGATAGQFTSLRGIDEGEKQIYMCYVGAEPTTYSQMFGIQSLNDIYERLAEWSIISPANGQKAGQGWCSDQIILYNTVKNMSPKNLNIIELEEEVFPRLDRGDPEFWIQSNDQLDTFIKEGGFIDFHLPYHPEAAARVMQIYSAAPKCQVWPY